MSRPDKLDHRLDDELRNAFKREQPSADFTMRVLDRVSLEPSPRLLWWQKLTMLLEPPKLRWLAIGVTASLLLAIGAIQYGRLDRGVVNDSGTVAQSGPAPEANSNAAVKSDLLGPNETATAPTRTPDIKRRAPASASQRSRLTRNQQEQELRAEGEAAKEKLMLALSIASSALNDAQRAVRDDGLRP